MAGVAGQDACTKVPAFIGDHQRITAAVVVGVTEAKHTLVVIPAHDEEATVGTVVRELRSSYDWDVLVVSDFSVDDTAEEARKAGALVLEAPIRLGAWGAVQAGMRYAAWKGYRRVVTMDADGQHGAETLTRILEPLDRGVADVVIGSCVSRASRARRLAWSFFRRLTGLPFADLTSGLRAYSHQVFDLAVSPEATLLDFQDVGVLVLLSNSGARIVEVPVPMTRRRIGKSRIFSSWARVLDYLMQTAILAVAKKFRADSDIGEAKDKQS